MSILHSAAFSALPPLAVPPSIFRAYDIRGIAGDTLTITNIEIIGKAMASLAREEGEDRILFGSDGRISSPALRAALLKGILSTGLNVIDLGTVPTPLLYFAAHTSEWGSGVMLTASHNPPDYNGIKIIRQRSCLTPEQLQHIRERADTGKFVAGKGSLTQMDFKALYIDRLRQDIHLQRRL